MLEKYRQWDAAIEFMKKVLQENPDNMDAYIFMNYLIMNMLVEEYYDKSKLKTYETLLKWYFDASYAKFFENPMYLYLTGKTAVMSEWFFGINVEDYENMIAKAHYLEPHNPLYNEAYYWDLAKHDPPNAELIEYVTMVTTPNCPVEQQLKDKGAVGEYILGLKRNWADGILR